MPVNPKAWTPEQYEKAKKNLDVFGTDPQYRAIKDQLEQGIGMYEAAASGAPVDDAAYQPGLSATGDVPATVATVSPSGSGFLTPDQVDEKLKAGAPVREKTSDLGSFLKGAQDEASLGLNDNAAAVGAAANGVVQRLTGDRSEGDTYAGESANVTARNAERESTGEARDDNPGWFLGGQFLGGAAPVLATGGLGPAANAARAEQAISHAAKPLLQRMLASAGLGAAQGGAQGALSGFGHSGDGTPQTAERGLDAPLAESSTLMDTLAGGGGGALAGGLLGPLMEGLTSLVPRKIGNKVWKGMKSETGNPDKAVTVRQAEAEGVQPLPELPFMGTGVHPGAKVQERLTAAEGTTRGASELAAAEAAPKVIEKVSGDRKAMGRRLADSKKVLYDKYTEPADTQELVNGILDIGNKDFHSAPNAAGDPTAGPFGKVDLTQKHADQMPTKITAQKLDKYIDDLRDAADPGKNSSKEPDKLEYARDLYKNALEFRKKNFPDLADLQGESSKVIGEFDTRATALGLPKETTKYDPHPLGQTAQTVEQRMRSINAEGGHTFADAAQLLLADDPDLLKQVRTVAGTNAYKAMRGHGDARVGVGMAGNMHIFGNMDSLGTRVAGLKNLGTPQALPASAGGVAGGEADSITEDDVAALRYWLQQRKERREGVRQ